MKRLRCITEAEAIGEFLKNEFYEPEYHSDRDLFERVVLQPDYADEQANAIRRALLFRRRGHMWRELPKDTQWWQVEVGPQDLSRIHVFPRAQWRKISNGSFCIKDVVERIRERKFNGANDRVIAKIQQLRYRLQTDAATGSTVLLIGMDDRRPLTILEGNHRLAAAMLLSPEVASTRFRVLCGFSPRMVESCWYQTDVPNLWRYLKNRLTHIYDAEANVRRLLPKGPSPMLSPAGSLAKAVGVEQKLTESQ